MLGEYTGWPARVGCSGDHATGREHDLIVRDLPLRAISLQAAPGRYIVRARSDLEHGSMART